MIDETAPIGRGTLRPFSVQHERVMSSCHRRPPFQLVEGDRHNLCLGLLAAFSLASCKDNDWLNKRISPFLRWQLNA